MFLDKAGRDEFEVEKVHELEGWRILTQTPDASKKGEVSDISIKGKINASHLTQNEWNFSIGSGSELFDKLIKIPSKLAEIANRIYQGPITSADSVFLFKEYRDGSTKTTQVFSKELNAWVTLETQILKPVIRSGNIGRYWAKQTAYVLFPYLVENNTAKLISQTELRGNYPLAWKYLSKNRSLLESREKNAFKDSQWYRFGRTQNLGLWEQPKLLIPYMITNLSTYFDLSDDFYFINVTTGGYGITIDESKVSYPYLSGLLNSRLLDFYLKRVSTTFHGGYFAANKQYIEQLPIRTINFSDPADKVQHDRMVSLVERMLELHKRNPRTPQEQEMVKRQLESTDRQIDNLVYELYGLTEEEINIVEGKD
jgi:hypothetical protein